MLPLPQNQFQFDQRGRKSVETRMQLYFGEEVIVIKGKAFIGKTASMLQNRVLTPQAFKTIFTDGIYPEWSGKPNELKHNARLVHVEYNRASSYLVFKILK